ncbi:hypothetical protein N7478_007059 [Penicillium angulare]|uniref:uncharacterized protein n=1 Tax=Penicillium angulare TaxID=116970 RepID=UPI00253F884D|nr:uncharacterized protein N7478_007059 [Penicillium angulare]KAJ5281687.1 hypothetical protein N7478_007059 [Penicillium angulare]
MPKYALTSVGGNIGTTAASYALEIVLVARGYMAETSNDVEILTGRKPLSFQETLLRYKHAFS